MEKNILKTYSNNSLTPVIEGRKETFQSGSQKSPIHSIRDNVRTMMLNQSKTEILHSVHSATAHQGRICIPTCWTSSDQVQILNAHLFDKYTESLELSVT